MKITATLLNDLFPLVSGELGAYLKCIFDLFESIFEVLE